MLVKMRGEKSVYLASSMALLMYWLRAFKLEPDLSPVEYFSLMALAKDKRTSDLSVLRSSLYRYWCTLWRDVRPDPVVVSRDLWLSSLLLSSSLQFSVDDRVFRSLTNYSSRHLNFVCRSLEETDRLAHRVGHLLASNSTRPSRCERDTCTPVRFVRHPRILEPRRESSDGAFHCWRTHSSQSNIRREIDGNREHLHVGPPFVLRVIPKRNTWWLRRICLKRARCPTPILRRAIRTHLLTDRLPLFRDRCRPSRLDSGHHSVGLVPLLGVVLREDAATTDAKEKSVTLNSFLIHSGQLTSKNSEDKLVHSLWQLTSAFD